MCRCGAGTKDSLLAGQSQTQRYKEPVLEREQAPYIVILNIAKNLRPSFDNR